MRKLLLPMVGCTVFVAGCHTDMWVQPRAEVQGHSDFFADQMDSRPKIEGTVARGHALDDPGYETGRENGKLVTEIPVDRAMKELNVTTYKDFILRGQERFEIFCQHCHGQLGDGQGMIAQRGLNLKRPVGNYHTDRLRKMAIGHFFDVMSHGQGVMFSMAAKVDVPDRWAIAAYIRALQRSQNPQAMEGITSNVQPSKPAQHLDLPLTAQPSNKPAEAQAR
jgi:mono/diheme cytochrome c family protein